jgi:ATP-binding cassette subfamily C protein LapB
MTNPETEQTQAQAQTHASSRPELKTDPNDPLLSCLALAAALLDCPVHLPTLRAGFATDEHGRVLAASYPDLAHRHGLVAAWSRVPLDQLPSFSLPVLVPCQDGRVFVLVRFGTGHERGLVHVLSPETGLQERSLSLQELMASSTGDLLLVRRAPVRADQTLVPLRGAAFSWFWGTLWRFKHFYVESMLATMIANVLTLASVFFTMNVYDRVVPTQAYASLWTLAIGTTVAVVLEFGMRWLKARLVDLGGKKADLAINAMLLREIMSIRLEHRPQSVGIFSSSMRDFEALRDFFSSASFVLLTDLPFLLMFIGLIFVIGGPIGWVSVLAVLVVLAVGYLSQPALTQAMRENMKEAGDKQSVLVESVLNLETVKAFNAEPYLQRRWENANEAGADSYKRIRSTSNLMLGLTSSLGQLITVGMVLIGVYQIHANQLTQGGLIAAVILAGRVIGPLSGVMGLASRLQQAITSLETLDGLMKRPRDREVGRQYVVPEAPPAKAGVSTTAEVVGRPAPAPATPALVLDELEFSYPGEHRVPVVRRLSMSMNAGSRTAMLGRIGSGKSTLLRLAAGLYVPSAGQVRVGGIELQQLEPTAHRSRMGWVGQDPMLFMGTLRENLTLADSWITDRRIVEVLQMLDMYGLVASHPRGLDMPLTEAGGGLSGGQRQLLSIARMMLRDPQFVFLDEPTASMDQNTENRVIGVLRQWLQGRTVLLATHRPQLLELVDTIAVIDAGRCVMQGPRDEMLERLSRGVNVAQPGSQA